MRTIEIASWLGRRDDEELEPTAMRYSASPCNSCHGCLFDGQASKVCRKASHAAIRAVLPDCDDGFIYVAVPVDARQLSLEGA
jgi:hypothetical protein